MSTVMLVRLANGIKTMKTLPGRATDDLFGWSERKDGETTRYPGILDGFDLTRDEVEALIMQARVKAGWVTEEELTAQQVSPPEAAAAPHDEDHEPLLSLTLHATAEPLHFAPESDSCAPQRAK